MRIRFGYGSEKSRFLAYFTHWYTKKKYKKYCYTVLYLSEHDKIFLYLRNSSFSFLLAIKSMDWFLYDNGLRHERVKEKTPFPS